MVARSGSAITDDIQLRFSMRFGLKHVLVVGAIIAFAVVLLAPFRGIFPPFYYEQYNAVKNRLDAVGGLQILDTCQHKDVFL